MQTAPLDTAPAPRLSFARLADVLGPVLSLEHHQHGGRHATNDVRSGSMHHEPTTDWPLGPAHAVAIRLGIARRVAQRYAIEGVPRQSVDRLLFPLGIHPAEVWGADYYADVAQCHSAGA